MKKFKEAPTMKTNDTIISVLKENKNALRGLHAAVGFDFEKPFLAETACNGCN